MKFRLFPSRQDINFVFQVTKAHFKMQNENSVLGIFWYLLGPLLLFGILVFVFSQRLGRDIEHYPLYVLLGIIMWNFFSTSTGRAMRTFVGNANILKAMPIRSDLLLVSTIMHVFVSHVLEISLVVAALLWLGIVPVLLPLFAAVLVLAFLFSTGVSLLLASTYVYLRDMDQIWSVITKAWWFATPIFYAPTTTGLGAKVSLFNPMFYVVHISRELLIYGNIPPVQYWGAFAGFSFGMLTVGYTVFYRFRLHFVDKV